MPICVSFVCAFWSIFGLDWFLHLWTGRLVIADRANQDALAPKVGSLRYWIVLGISPSRPKRIEVHSKNLVVCSLYGYFENSLKSVFEDRGQFCC